MARREKHEEHQNHERWLVSYADFITLLFAFFVVMYSVSSVNEGKYRVLSESIESSFKADNRSLSPIQIGHIKKDTTQNKSQSLIQLNPIDKSRLNSSGPKARTLIKIGLEGLPPPRFYDVESDSNKKQTDLDIKSNKTNSGDDHKKKKNEKFKNLSENLEKALSPLMKQGLVDVSKNDTWVEVEINSSILFSSGRAQLSRQSIPVLEKIAKLLSPVDVSVYVEGFTDNIPISNIIFPSNWELSAARAASVVHLFSRSGVSPLRLAATGFGEHHPIASNETAEGRLKNRRVVLIINSDVTPRYIKNKKPKKIAKEKVTVNQQTKQKPGKKQNTGNRQSSSKINDQPQIRLGPGLE